MRKIQDVHDFAGKTVLLRVDLNVPIHNGHIEDETRIRKVLPTIDFLRSQNANVILLSHFGRPSGIEKKYSMRFLIPVLQEMLGCKVLFSPSLEDAASGQSSVILLENIRFWEGEELNDPLFAKKLSELADIYVNDAFSCSHRAHASIDAITKFLPSYAGLFMQLEVEALEKVVAKENKPVVVIVAGKKVSTKLPVLENLVRFADKIIIAGGMANTLLKSQGIDIGSSYFEESALGDAKQFLDLYHEKVLLPVDFLCLEGDKVVKRGLHEMKSSSNALDVGYESIKAFNRVIENSKTLLWNGPLGFYEDDRFLIGTTEVAQFVADRTKQDALVSVAGGGDTVSALLKSGVSERFSYISTAGGAFLEWLEGNEPPGLKALK